MSKLKKILLFALATMLLLSSTVALAAGAELNIQRVNVNEDGSLEAIFQLVTGGNVNKSGIGLQIGNEPVAYDSLENYKDDPQGVSWVILLDNGTLDVNANTHAYNLMSDLITLLPGKNDNITVIPMSAPTSFELLEGENNNVFVQSLTSNSYSKKNTNDVQNIMEVLKKLLPVLNANEGLKGRVNLVIVTNGTHSGVGDEISDEQLRKMLVTGDDTPITVHTFIVSSANNITEEHEKTYAPTERLAKAGFGGMACRITKKTAANVITSEVKKVKDNERNFFRLVANPAKKGVVADKLMLAYKEGDIAVSKEYTFKSEDIARMDRAVPTPTPIPKISPEPTPTEFWEGEFLEIKVKHWALILLAGILLIVALILLLKPKKPEPEPAPVPAPSPFPNFDDSKTMPIGPTVTLVAQTPEQSRYEFPMASSDVVVGRNNIRNGDRHMSKSHMQLKYDAGVMVAKNLSINDTYVNDNKLKDSFTSIANGSKVRMGKSEFIIYWK